MDFVNPYMYIGTPQASEAWETGFCIGFCSPAGYSVQLPHPIVQADLEENFKKGIVDGQTAAAFGWDVVKPPYMEARQGEPAGKDLESLFTGFHASFDFALDGASVTTKAIFDAAQITLDSAVAVESATLGGGLLRAAASAIIGAMIEMVFTGYGLVWTKPVEQTELPDFGERVANYLISRGIHSCAIYMGAAADPKAAGKELWVTPMFREQRDASKAAKEIGRKAWVVMEWRTDACESFRIVDGPGW